MIHTPVHASWLSQIEIFFSVIQKEVVPVGMIGVQPHFGPGDEVGLAFLVESMRVAEPLIVGTGVATAEEIGMETFEQRFRDEGERTQPLVGAPFMLLSAWATTGQE